MIGFIREVKIKDGYKSSTIPFKQVSLIIMMSKVPIHTDKASKPRPVYNQAIKANGFVFCSRQLPKDLNGALIEGTIQDRTHKCIQSLCAVLETAGSSLDKVVEVNVFLLDIDDLQRRTSSTCSALAT
ncbi:unnamed protein product [Clonostachys rhizophaga]|uniref:Uncharacterized protein n=1 Tax=Clonostachys rhizophaga TaxID=160324 RepID=A0A9N9VWK4_9HYPO|nr:unnamed protein product [Clonostachys rhizophaga]